MLIANAAESHLVSSLGWVDRGAVWCCETATQTIRRVPLGDAAFLTLRPGSEGLFAAVHHHDGKKVLITAHRIEAPEDAVARVELSGTHFAFDGEKHVWRCLPRTYVANYEFDGKNDYCIFVIDPDRHTVEHHWPSWYDNSYDKKQHGIVGVAEAPGAPHVVISIQRDHEPVLYDPIDRRLIRKIMLAGHYGNPMLMFRRRASEMWATDYDHLVKVETIDWSVVKSARLQAAKEPQALFIGDFGFNADESLCAVARPFSGDVLALDTHTMDVTARAAVGREPLEVALLRDQRVFARDWKTGDLLTGILKPL
jgi:hypothetical protein